MADIGVLIECSNLIELYSTRVYISIYWVVYEVSWVNRIANQYYVGSQWESLILIILKW